MRLRLFGCRDFGTMYDMFTSGTAGDRIADAESTETEPQLLVLDDDPAIVSFFSARARQVGFDVTSYTDYFDALLDTCLEKRVYDAVWVDNDHYPEDLQIRIARRIANVDLPPNPYTKTGFDFIDALRSIRAEYQQVPFAITDTLTEIDKARGFSWGATVVAVKPFGVNQLDMMLETMLRAAQTRIDQPYEERLDGTYG